MNNLLYGILTVALSTVSFYYAYKLYRVNKVNLALLLLMLGGLLLRVYTAGDSYLHAWDERYHALVAKNMMQHPLKPTLYDDPVLPYDFKNWTANHVWVHKQPFPLWCMSISMSVFGVNEMALRLPSILLSTLGIYLIFYIARYFYSTRVALIAAFLYAIHGLIIELTAGRTATDHIDVFFLFFIQLAVFFAIRYFQSTRNIYTLFIGVSLGIALLSKWLPALIVLPLWLLLALYSKTLNRKEMALHFTFILFAASLIALPWQWYIFNAFPREAAWESDFNVRHLSEALEDHDHPFYYHFSRIRIQYGELIYLPLSWFFYKTFKNIRNLPRLIFSLWILIPLVIFSFAQTKMPAYTLISAPAIFIVTAVFWEYLYRYRRQFKSPILLYALLILLLALPVRYTLERVKPFHQRERNPPWAQELRALRQKLPQSPRAVIFNARRPVETMFYTPALAYSHLPDSATIATLQNKGYAVYLRKKRDKYPPPEGSKESPCIGPSLNACYVKW